MERNREGKGIVEEILIIRNLVKEFDMDFCNFINIICKGILTGMKNRDCDILGKIRYLKYV